MSRGRADLLNQPVGGYPGPAAYTPTITWTGATISSPTGNYVKLQGGLFYASGSFVISAIGGSATLSISLPPGFVIAGGISMATVVTGAAAAIFPRALITETAWTIVATPQVANWFFTAMGSLAS